MENETQPENETPEPAPWEGTKQYLRLTRENYETARRKRLQYLLLYGFIFFLWAGMFLWASTHATETSESPPPAIFFVLAVYFTCFALFYVRFVSVMRVMGFSLFWLVLLCVVLIPPIPGLLILGAIDRRTLKMLEQARKLFEAVDGETS